MKPLVKWAGGKARLAPLISEAFGGPCEGIYYEPFMGSASVFLHRKALREVQRAVLSDVNRHLMNAYREVRIDAAPVIEALRKLPHEDWHERYYEIRDAFNGANGVLTPVDAAAHFFWLNRACFNGLYRENKQGMFNVPVGQYKRLSLLAPVDFWLVAQYLQDADLFGFDFKTMFSWGLSPVGDRPPVVPVPGLGDHVYLDPPYVPLSKTANFTGYTARGFSLEDQTALARLATYVAHRGARVVVSNADVSLVRELYRKEDGWTLQRVEVQRSISRGPRGKVGEIIAVAGPRDD